MKLIDKDALVAEIERLEEAIKATAIDDRISKEQAEAYKVCVKIRYFVEDILEEIDDEQIRKRIIQSLHGDVLDIEETNKAISWLKKQGDKDSQVIFPSFTFDNILALQCCMETVKKVQEDKDLYEKLKDLHDRVYDAYQFEKQNDNADNVEHKDYNNIDPHFGKPVDKVESKFKVGDWVVIENIVFQIDNISGIYLILSTIDRTVPINYKYIPNDNKIHLWTIDDAKDGDVLVSGSNQPFIYNGKFTEDTVGAYCGIDIYYDLVINYSPENWGENWTGNNNIRPATKEQRGFLFRKMKEAGYEWNKEKKKLIKL